MSWRATEKEISPSTDLPMSLETRAEFKLTSFKAYKAYKLYKLLNLPLIKSGAIGPLGLKAVVFQRSCTVHCCSMRFGMQAFAHFLEI